MLPFANPLQLDDFALVCGERRLSYRELEVASTSIAVELIARGLAPGESVAVLASRSVESIAAILGVLLAGAHFVPFEWTEGSMGSDSLRNAVKMSGASWFVGPEGSRSCVSDQGRWIEQGEAYVASKSREFDLPPPGNLAYGILTSGSSGTPKCVLVTRANLTHYLTSISAVLDFDRPLAFAHVSSLAADLGHTSLFGALHTGGCLHLVDDATRRDPAAFQRYLSANCVDILKITPSHFGALFPSRLVEFSRPIQSLILGGERLSRSLVVDAFKLGLFRQVVNHYGPSETTIGVAVFPMSSAASVPEEADSVPIGWALGDTKLVIVGDQFGAPAPESCGELVVAGPGVAHGYLHTSSGPEMEKFGLRDLGTGGLQWSYATGDRCRRLADGSLEFVSRVDRQVKRRGFRVELDGVEAILETHAWIERAAVMVHESGCHSRLVAYVVPSIRAVGVEAKEVVDEASRFASEKLPVHSQPDSIVVKAALPLSSNGKLDPAALVDESSEPVAVIDSETTSFLGIEGIIRRIWQRQLVCLDPNLADDFFEFGGDSISAIQLVAQIQACGLTFSHRAFLEDPTLGGVIRAVGRSKEYDHHSPRSLQLDTSAQQSVLSPAQLEFFADFEEPPNHWCQAIVLGSRSGFDRESLNRAFEQVVRAHELLHTRFIRNSDGSWHAQPGTVLPEELLRVAAVEGDAEFRTNIAALYQAIRIESGAVLRACLCRGSQGDRLVVVAHHLVVDGVSWRIIAEDLARAYRLAKRGEVAFLASDHGTFWHRMERLRNSALAATFEKEAEKWESIELEPQGLNLQASVKNQEGSTRVVWFGFDQQSTRDLQSLASSENAMALPFLLLAAFGWSAAAVFSEPTLRIAVEGHGRNLRKDDEIDQSRSVGWFTSTFPVIFSFRECANFDQAIKHVRGRLDVAAEGGLGAGMRIYRDGRSRTDRRPYLIYNYLGEFQLVHTTGLDWTFTNDYAGPTRDPAASRLYAFKLTARKVRGRLVVDLSYDRESHSERSVIDFAQRIQRTMRSLIRADSGSGGNRPSDGPLVRDESSSGLLTYCPAELFAAAVRQVRADSKVLFLTGATGFVGIHLLREWLHRTEADVVCLIRAEGDQQAQERLKKEYCWHFGDDDGVFSWNRVRCVSGDTTNPRMGLDQSTYEGLAARCDGVLHSAADVRLFAPMRELRKSNIVGTGNVIEFAQSIRPKTLDFISTLGVAGRNPDLQLRHFSEQDDNYGQLFLNPYEESKLEAERLVRSHSECASTRIYRLGSVLAPLSGGRFQRNGQSNRIVQSLAAYIEIGMVPDLGEEQLIGLPVDAGARAVVSLMRKPSDSLPVFHLADIEATVSDLFQTLSLLGYELRQVSREEFARGIDRVSKMDGRLASARMWSLRPKRGVHFDATATNGILASLGMELPKLSHAQLSRLVSRCLENVEPTR